MEGPKGIILCVCGCGISLLVLVASCDQVSVSVRECLSEAAGTVAQGSMEAAGEGHCLSRCLHKSSHCRTEKLALSYSILSVWESSGVLELEAFWLAFVVGSSVCPEPLVSVLDLCSLAFLCCFAFLAAEPLEWKDPKASNKLSLSAFIVIISGN